MDIPGLRSPFFIRCITPTVTITVSLQSGQHHIILTPFMIIPIMDLLLVTGMIYIPVAIAGIHFVGSGYQLPPGASYGSSCTFYTGSYSFTLSDIEVFYDRMALNKLEQK